MLLLQLKSSQSEESLRDIQEIHSKVFKEAGYRIRGHEVQQITSIVNKTTIHERAKRIANFCIGREIDYLTYHSLIYQNGENIWDPRWRDTLRQSIIGTAQEAQMVQEKLALKTKIVIVVHLTNYIPLSRLPITLTEKFKMQEKQEAEFLSLYNSELKKFPSCRFAIENAYPRYSAGYAVTGPFHPYDIARLEGHGIGTVLDLAHYQLYLNYNKAGTGNICGDLDRDANGAAPSWPDCIEILSSSLIQIHVSNARGMTHEGEGLPLWVGEIDIVKVLGYASSLANARPVQATIELAEGHLYSGRLQLESVLWLLKRIRPEIFS